MGWCTGGKLGRLKLGILSQRKRSRVCRLSGLKTPSVCLSLSGVGCNRTHGCASSVYNCVKYRVISRAAVQHCVKCQTLGLYQEPRLAMPPLWNHSPHTGKWWNCTVRIWFSANLAVSLTLPGCHSHMTQDLFINHQGRGGKALIQMSKSVPKP